MWISKKRLKALEKRIADLEVQVQSQQVDITFDGRELSRSIVQSLREAIRDIPEEGKA